MLFKNLSCSVSAMFLLFSLGCSDKKEEEKKKVTCTKLAEGQCTYFFGTEAEGDTFLEDCKAPSIPASGVDCSPKDQLGACHNIIQKDLSISVYYYVTKMDLQTAIGNCNVSKGNFAAQP